MKKIAKSINAVLERFLPLICIVFFLAGIGLSRISSGFAEYIDKIIGGFINNYQFIAPMAIYIIVTPAFTKILSERKSNGKGFVAYSLAFFARLRIMACVWACIFTTLVFGLPLFINHTVSFGGALARSLNSMGYMLTHSAYFYALYASIITVLVAARVKKLEDFLSGKMDVIEKIGAWFVPIVPFFMLFIGSYVAHLPVNLKNQLGDSLGGVSLNTVNIFGISIKSATPTGMIMAYLAGALLTGIACFIWHFGLLIWAKIVSDKFSFRKYFKDYWIQVYPILWATSSEALATPLNLYLVKKNYSQIRTEVRRFVVGIGSFMNINGTIICVFVLAGLVAKILNIQISLLDLLFCIPIVFLIGYGVPGIPGELLMFGGPLVVLLRISPESAPFFLALYLGLQIGLPDSFRTGANSTDQCPTSLILENVYEKRFLNEKETVEVEAPVIIVPVMTVALAEATGKES